MPRKTKREIEIEWAVDIRSSVAKTKEYVNTLLDELKTAGPGRKEQLEDSLQSARFCIDIAEKTLVTVEKCIADGKRRKYHRMLCYPGIC